MSTVADQAVEPQTDVPPSAEVQAEGRRRAFRAHDWADEIDKLDVAPSVKLVAHGLAKRWNTKTKQCNPKQQTLATGLHLKESTVRRAVWTLRGMACLAVDHGRGNRASYRLLWPADRDDDLGLDQTLDRDDDHGLDRDDDHGPTRTTKGNYGSRCRSSGEVAHAHEPETTTTTAATSDVGTVDDAEALLALYEESAETETGRKPRRRPEDIEAARALVPMVGFKEFEQVCDWAMRDPFSRKKGGVARSFTEFAKRYDPIADKCAEMDETYCCECEIEERLDSEEQREYEHHGIHICRACKADGKNVIQ